jgi:hypothetical protein
MTALYTVGQEATLPSQPGTRHAPGVGEISSDQRHSGRVPPIAATGDTAEEARHSPCGAGFPRRVRPHDQHTPAPSSMADRSYTGETGRGRDREGGVARAPPQRAERCRGRRLVMKGEEF